MTVDEALAFFQDEPHLHKPLALLHDIGLGYLRLGQPATELSGGEAQRIKLATELQRAQRADALYILDEPTTGLHAADVDRLLVQLNGLVDAGNTVVLVEHDMRAIAESDWIIDIGPGAGENGGSIVATGTPEKVAQAPGNCTATYLRRFLATARMPPISHAPRSIQRSSDRCTDSGTSVSVSGAARDIVTHPQRRQRPAFERACRREALRLLKPHDRLARRRAHYAILPSGVIAALIERLLNGPDRSIRDAICRHGVRIPARVSRRHGVYR